MSAHHRGQANGSRSARWDAPRRAATPGGRMGDAALAGAVAGPAAARRAGMPVAPARTITSLAAQREAHRETVAGQRLPDAAARSHLPLPAASRGLAAHSKLAPADRAQPIRALTASVPGAEAATDEFDWQDVLTLPRATVRSRTRLGSAVCRSMLWGHGRRNLAVAGLLACCALTAACGSATRLAHPEGPATAVASIPAMPVQASPAQVADASLPGAPLAPGLRAAGRARYANRAEPVHTAELRTAEGAPDAERPPPAEAAPDASAEPSLTRLVAFRSAPFPYEGLTGEGTPFLNVAQGDQRGHRGRRGFVLWADRTFSDNRALVHVPARFDPAQSGALVVFFHGYGATLSRDVAARQQVPQQVTESGANAVLVAPQFAVDARDPSAGHFWEPGGCARFLDEAARQVAAMRDIPAARISRLPLVFVPYSGGFYTAALCLKDPAVARRTRAVLMLDAAYGDLETYADWASSQPGNLFVSGYTHFTARQNAELRSLMAGRGVAIYPRLPDAALRGGAVFLPADSPHNDYVTQAWTEEPIRDLLMRMPSLHEHDPQALAAADLTPTGSLH